MDRFYDVEQIEELYGDGLCGAGVSTAAAARLANVAAGTVRSWAARGKLTVVGRDERGRAYYDAQAVVDVELATRRACAGRPRLQH